MKTQTMNKDVSSDWIISPIGPYLVEYSQFSSDTDSFPVMTSSRNGLMIQEEYYTKTQNSKLNKVGYHLVPPGYFTYRHMSDDSVFHFNINDTGKTVLVSPEYPVFTTKEMEPKFLLEYLNHSRLFLEFCKAQKKGSTRTRLYFNVLKQFVFPIPPLSQQQKIAEILSACERVLTLKKELKAQKIKQKKWLMQKLLNPVSGVRLPGFMDEWETVTLGDLFDFSTSLSASRDKLGTDGIPYLHYGDIHKSSQTFIDVAMDWETLPKLKIGEIQDKYLLKDGDVVFVDASEDYEGASKYVVIYNPENRPFLAGLHTLPAHSKTDRLDRQFKRFCFQSHFVKTQVMFYLSGMKVYGLNRENIGKIKLSLPSLAEQTAIAEVLSAADRELDLLEEEIQAWERKKKALSQLLLRGIVRV